MTYTPGTWVISGQHCQDHPLGILAGALCVAAICDQGVSDTNLAQMEANARLIAAAPEMLAALRSMCQAYQVMFDAMPVAWQTYDNIAQAAIAAATGGTP